MPVAGRLCTIFTPRVYLLASIVVQAGGLLVTSQAQSLWMFLAGRAMTGVGSASVTPVAFILVAELTSPRRRGLLFGCINTGYTAGVACGAIIAGALEPVVGWRAVFWLQIPFGLSAALVAFVAIPPTTKMIQTSKTSWAEKLSRIDYLGVLTLISSVILLSYSLSAPRVQLTPILLSAAALVLFVFVEANWAVEPIVPVPVLRSRGNIFTGIATIGIMTARWGVLFYTPTYAITLRGWSPASAGLMLIPTNAGFGLGGLAAGWLHIRRSGSFYMSCLVMFVLFSGSMFTLSGISTPDSNIYFYVSLLFFNGFVTGALLNYSLAHVLHLTPASTHVIVIPLNATFRSISGSFGSAVSGGLFLRTLQHTLKTGFAKRGISGRAELIKKLVGTPLLVQKLSGVDKIVAVEGYTTALRTLFMAGAGLAVIVFFFQAGTGWEGPDLPKKEDELSNPDTLSPVVSREPVPS